jgi:hypothetical protein
MPIPIGLTKIKVEHPPAECGFKQGTKRRHNWDSYT